MLRHEPILHGRQARQRESFLVHRQWMIGSASDVSHRRPVVRPARARYRRTRGRALAAAA
jgi:hypothetical protein